MRRMNRRAFLQRTAAATGAGFVVSAAAVSAGSDAAAVQLSAHVHVLPGGVNTGVLVSDGAALLFDCCDSVTNERVAVLGAGSVEMICCTQHRRPNMAGAYRFVEAGSKLVVPKAERHLFEETDAYWNDWKNRWHVYHSEPGPQVAASRVAVDRGVGEGDVIEWRGFRIRVLDTPGATDGSVSYVVEDGDEVIVFCGDVLFGHGQIYELYSLQKGFGTIGDYHGFLGNRRKLIASLRKLGESGATCVAPSHGGPIREVKAATQLAEQRLDTLWRNYTSISALNHYFPSLFNDTADDPARMKPAETSAPPDWVRRVAFTSFAVVSETGAALLVDCGHDSVVAKLQEWLKDKTISAVEGCWVTHYHDDHVDSLPRFANTFSNAPIMCDEHLADIVEHPQRYFLPCISPCGAPVGKATKDGESWPWHEFTLRAFHFPGQTLYHGGLLVEGRGATVFFAGDSGAPTGLDDYCAGNRVFLGPGRGSRYCLDLWRKLRPGHIINEHQDKAFSFTPEQIDYMDGVLEERERLVGELCPWKNVNFAMDPWWVRTWPYDQEALPGNTIRMDVQFTNHGDALARAEVEPVVPRGWEWERNGSAGTEVAAKADGAIRIWLRIPDEAGAGRYTIPVRVTWDGEYLGQYRHGIVEVAGRKG